MLIQLHEPLAVETPLGKGYAVLVEAGGDEQWWTVLLSETRALVTFRQDQIRAARSYSHGRGVSERAMRKIIKGGT